MVNEDNTIICGSRKYEHTSFDTLVDSFDIIVRHNMLLPNNNYGKRNASHQILNAHVYRHYIEDCSLSRWHHDYHGPFGISTDHIASFYEYLKEDDVIFQHFDSNNIKLMRSVLDKHSIDHKIEQQLRCGLSYVAECIHIGVKPFLIGFSLLEEHDSTQQYASKYNTTIYHNTSSERALVKKLHEANLIDATFCTIADSSDIQIDSSLLILTDTNLDIIREFLHGC